MRFSRLLGPLLCAAIAGACAPRQPSASADAPARPSVDAPARPSADAPARPSVMILGAYHMANPGQDEVNVAADDVLSEHRQREIAEVIERLAAYAPTKIALEATPEHAVELNALYAAYRRGEHALSRDERQQLGFRLAARLGHAQLYGVDVHIPMAIDEAMAAGQRNGQSQLLQPMQAKLGEIAARLQAINDGHTVREILLFHNGEELDSWQGFYLLMAQLGSTAEPVGARVTAGWYERNLLIFANVARLVENDQERVLVLIGSGHGKLLREFVAGSANLTLVRAQAYLER